MDRENLKVKAERAVLAGMTLPGEFIDPTDRFREIRALAATAGATVVGEINQKRRRPHARTFLGKGKTEELGGLIKATDASIVIFDHDLSPAQIRNLEQATETKIVDRSELILDIFANRATTHMAKLQVEIAQLEYTYPRLRAMWTHLGQVTGGAPVGIGTRGPGEQQLEIDRRLVQRRLSQLKRELAEIQARKTREVEARNTDHYTVGLVGYTNAGKSTLFNTLTAGGAYAHDKLFATLGTRVEAWNLGGGNEVLLSDTVGFIRNLPHHLVASFRSTLEETVYADLLVIVVDAADENAGMHLETVRNTLDEIGAVDQPRIIVLNKVDRVADNADVLVWLNQEPDALPISAATGRGLEELTEQVLEQMTGPVRTVEIALPMKDSRSVTFLEKRAEVLDRKYDNGTVTMRVAVGRRHVDLLLASGAQMVIDGRPGPEARLILWPEPAAADPVRVPPHERAWGKT